MDDPITITPEMQAVIAEAKAIAAEAKAHNEKMAPVLAALDAKIDNRPRHYQGRPIDRAGLLAAIDAGPVEDRSPPYLGPTYVPNFTPLISDAHGPIIMAFEDPNGKYTRMSLTFEQAVALAYSFNMLVAKRLER